MDYKNMLDGIKPYLIACVFCFFILPLGTIIFPQNIVMTTYEIASILVIDITSLLCGYRNFRWYYPLFVISLYALSTLAFSSIFNGKGDYIAASIIFYLLISYMAMAIGVIVQKFRSKRRGL